MKKLLPAIILVSIYVYVFSVSKGISAINSSISEYSPSDTDTNYYAAASVYNGEGLYEHFSSPYPPGRFIALAGMFRAVGASIPSSTFFFNFFAPLLFPILLYILSYLVIKKLTSMNMALLLALIPVVIDGVIVRSAQEVHVFVLLFFIVQLWLKNSDLKKFVSGLLLGLVFLFRIETGFFLLAGIFLAHMKKPRVTIESFYGFCLVWVPVLLSLLYTKSFMNFSYDVLYLGMVSLPHSMAQAIQPDHLPLFIALLIFMSASGLSLFVRKDTDTVKVLAVVSVLSFSTALSRSDEGHLWYGAIWFSFYCGLLVASAKEMFSRLSKSVIVQAAIYAVIFVVLGILFVHIKSPMLFVGGLACVFAALVLVRKKPSWVALQIGGIVAALMVFHSVSYVRLRLALPSGLAVVPSYSNGFFQDDDFEIAGLTFPESDIQALNLIQQKIPSTEKYIFIFPNHYLYYDYFQQQNPTRYYYNNNEQTPDIQADTLVGIQSTQTKYFLIFSEEARLKGGDVWKWILENTKAVGTYELSGKKVELRVRIPTSQDIPQGAQE